MPLQDNFLPVAGNSYGGDMMENLSIIRNPGIRRPYFDGHGKPCVTVNTGRWTTEKGERKPILERRRIVDLMNQGFVDPVFLTANASSLRKEDWIELDRVVILAARQRMKAWSDLSAANSFGGFNGMAKLTLEYEAMSDPGEAIVDMDGLSEGRTDSPLFKLRSLPLPITHSDFHFSERRLAVSRNSTPLDTTMAESCSRRVAESIEKDTIGIQTGISYGYSSTGRTAHDVAAPSDGHGAVLGGSNVYGYANYPHRLTKTNFTVPTGGGWTPDTLHNEVLAALDQLYANKFYGPFHIYHSIDWTQYMNRVYAVSGGNNAGETTRSMLGKIQGISGVDRLDFFTSTYSLLFVQMTSDVARAVNGLGVTTVQWPSVGGMRQNFKIMAIQVPQIRSDYNGQCGILHGTTT